MSASSTMSDTQAWETINWAKVEQYVYRLQVRITKAIRAGRYGKAKSLGWLLTHSRSAKLLSIKQVTESKGSRTAGVDGVHWKSASRKYRAVDELKRRGYSAQPLRSVEIPKKQGGIRKLGIPTLKDRAMQALHAMALLPWAETQGDLNSYGFRRERSTQDALHQCYTVLSRKDGAEWILEADIKSCFDQISHEWLMDNIPMDKKMLQSWLSAGHTKGFATYWNNRGTPQGGVISPLLANMALDGLEEIVKKSCPRKRSKINCIRYADDFIVTASKPQLLQEKVRPSIEKFLASRGLTLSEKKTGITSIHEGFDFLGFHIRKYSGKFLTKPSKANIKRFLREIRRIIKQGYGWSSTMLIKRLNPVITGWANYYRGSSAKATYGKVDDQIYRALYHWIMRRHQGKHRRQAMMKYFRYRGSRKRWIFVTKTQTKAGKSYWLSLKQMMDTRIQRHIKIRSAYHPFDVTYKDYMIQRNQWKQKIRENQSRMDRIIYIRTQQSRRIASK